MYGDSSALEDIRGEISYKKYRYRFVISAIYLLGAIVNSWGWVCTSPILARLSDIYVEPLTYVTVGASTIYQFFFIPSSFLANYIIDTYGLRVGIMIGNALTILSLWVKVMADEEFTFILIGQAIGGIAAPFIMNTPQKISSVWYPPEERNLSTTILSLAAPIGVGIGFTTTGLVVDDHTIGQDGKDQVVKIFKIIALIGSVLLAPGLLLIREKPPTPPSKAAAAEKADFKESMRQLLKNKNYLIFLFGTSMMWGTYGTLATVMQPLILPFNYTSTQSGYYGGIVLIMGLIGSPLWGAHVAKTKKYKRSLLILGTCSTLMLVFLIIVGPLENFYITAVGIALYGFTTTPMLPIIFEFCCELTFPVSESSSGGVTYMMTQFMAIIGSLVLSALLANKEKSSAYAGFFVLIGFQVFGWLGFFFTKEDLRRNKFEVGAGEGDLNEKFTSSAAKDEY